jgi:hypothetical protein
MTGPGQRCEKPPPPDGQAGVPAAAADSDAPPAARYGAAPNPEAKPVEPEGAGKRPGGEEAGSRPAGGRTPEGGGSSPGREPAAAPEGSYIRASDGALMVPGPDGRGFVNAAVLQRLGKAP